MNRVRPTKRLLRVIISSAIALVLFCGILLQAVHKTSALTGTLRPDGEITNTWPITGGTDDATCSGAGFCSRVDEATLNTADYISTGTAGSGGEQEIFSMENPAASSIAVNSITVVINASSVCASTCDNLLVFITTDNGATYGSYVTQALSATATSYSITFPGSWTDISGLGVRIFRQLAGSGNNDDNVFLNQVYATYDYTVVPNPSIEQAAYRWLANQNSATPGAALANNNTALTAVSPGTQMRLRMLSYISADDLTTGLNGFRLQYAVKSGSCDTSFSGEVYNDVKSTTPIAFYDNTSVADGASIVTTANDPTDGRTITAQAYVESASTSVLANTTAGNDAMWDFSLTALSGTSGDYCLRLVRGDSKMLNTYTVIPEVQVTPSITAIYPNSGPVVGGTPFMLTGAFSPSATVTIGGVAATNVFTIDGGDLVGTAPSGSLGAKNVVVTSGTGTATMVGGYTYSDTGIAVKSAASDFSAGGTLTNLQNGPIVMDNGAFLWQDSTPYTIGGSMVAGTYYYSVTALDKSGIESTRGTETRAVTIAGSAGRVSLRWRPIPGAYGYKVYRTTTSGTYGASSLVATLTNAQSSSMLGTIGYEDSSSATVNGTPPSVNNTYAGIYVSRGTVPGAGIGTMTTGPTVVGTTANALGYGAHFLARPDGTYLLIQGWESQDTSIYNPATNTFSAGPSTGVIASWGTHSFKLPNGNYFVMFGGTNTRYYNPTTNQFSAAPTLPMAVSWGGNSIRLENGNFLIISGGGNMNTAIFNTSTYTISSGPTVTTQFYVGSHAIKRPNGTWLVIHGGSSVTSIYNESTNTFTAGPSLSGGTACSSGCTSLERPNGTWLILHGTATATTTIYDPVANTTAVGPTLPGTTHDGQNPLELPDGRWLIIRGNSSSTATSKNTYIYNPYTNSFITGPDLSYYASAETPWVQLPDGRYLIMHGNGSATSSIYDAGWMIGAASQGQYTSEIFHPDGGTTLKQLAWAKSLSTDFTVEYRTGATREAIAAAPYTIATNGMLLNIGGQPWLQYRITFTRKVPDNSIGHSNFTPGVWGSRFTKDYRNFLTPLLPAIYTTYDKIPANKILRNNKYFNSSGQLQPFSTISLP